MPDDHRTVDPPKLVDIHHNNTWWPSRLTAWIRFRDGWHGLCHWNEGPGLNYGTTVRPDQLRPRE